MLLVKRKRHLLYIHVCHEKDNLNAHCVAFLFYASAVLAYSPLFKRLAAFVFAHSLGTKDTLTPAVNNAASCTGQRRYLRWPMQVLAMPLAGTCAERRPSLALLLLRPTTVKRHCHSVKQALRSFMARVLRKFCKPLCRNRTTRRAPSMTIQG